MTISDHNTCLHGLRIPETCSYYTQSPRNSLTYSGERVKVWEWTHLCASPTFQLAWGQVLTSLSQYLHHLVGKNMIYCEDYHEDYR